MVFDFFLFVVGCVLFGWVSCLVFCDVACGLQENFSVFDCRWRCGEVLSSLNLVKLGIHLEGQSKVERCAMRPLTVGERQQMTAKTANLFKPNPF